MKNLASPQELQARINRIRDQQIMVDSDLADIYGVETRVLNQAVRRNSDKFPSDFVFRLTRQEAEDWRRSRSHSVIMNRGHNIKYLPLAFTEHGAIMAANVLHSRRASRMSVFVVRAFVRMRSLLGQRQELAEQLAALENKLTRRMDAHEMAIVDVLRRVMRLLEPPPPRPEPPRRHIGFRSR
jgi:hypothetical protein